ncbi:MAG: ribosomal-protein-alanine N-acetyltransferase [Betaproteobacteria bacterium]|jgi:ribosomal-protein-alanine N-acetyltransferase|nr:ribosomal protein S18-alanine N-acetyltransferase [Pseudomonadota bacterium]NBO02737.1 ribosomal-protein-alanine N-acetyltransferase [Betaproteobacteria bacterium]HAB48496.1 ribosomal-protein-alanine N-acetyltransferase [Lautropia sp.]NBO95383.1 ribosomal-protein-alanine N-acetyltransferase [Betaproteobacteria bacterium]NBP34122.1 ribosomal-protein-alanine N-acetyltransferase [Betaproteobacteria bacterium]
MARFPIQEARLKGLRPMSMLDLSRVAAIERRIYDFPWTEGNFRDSLNAGHEGWLLEAVDMPGKLKAYALLMWIVDEVHLLNLSVSDDEQGRGLGRRLLDWLMRHCFEEGAQSMLLEVRPSNQAALRLYAAFGFEQVSTRKGYYPARGGGREDAWVLRCQLGLEEP